MPHGAGQNCQPGALPPPPSAELVQEMMAFIGCAEIPDDTVPMMLGELNLDAEGVPSAEAPPVTHEDFPVVVIGCGQSGLLAGIRLRETGA